MINDLVHSIKSKILKEKFKVSSKYTFKENQKVLPYVEDKKSQNDIE